MKLQRTALLDKLTDQTNRLLSQARVMRELSLDQLRSRPAPESWNALECLEHLNLYGDFYLPQIEEKLLRAPNAPGSSEFRSGWLGNYFANAMLPSDGKAMQTMKTFADKNTLGLELDITTVDRFIKQQERMLRLLEDSRTADLGAVKISITLSRWVRLRLGDTFRFLINHNERHMMQAEKALAASAALGNAM